MASGSALVAERMASAPPLVIPEGPPGFDPTSIPVPAGPIEPGSSGSSGSKDNEHGSGAPAQAGGEEATEPRVKRGAGERLGESRDRGPSPAVSESRKVPSTRGMSPPAYRGRPSFEDLKSFWERHHGRENEGGEAWGVRWGSDGYGELKRGRLDERYFPTY